MKMKITINGSEIWLHQCWNLVVTTLLTSAFYQDEDDMDHLAQNECIHHNLNRKCGSDSGLGFIWPVQKQRRCHSSSSDRSISNTVDLWWWGCELFSVPSLGDKFWQWCAREVSSKMALPSYCCYKEARKSLGLLSNNRRKSGKDARVENSPRKSPITVLTHHNQRKPVKEKYIMLPHDLHCGG